jgi:hypothetical protein
VLLHELGNVVVDLPLPSGDRHGAIVGEWKAKCQVPSTQNTEFGSISALTAWPSEYVPHILEIHSKRGVCTVHSLLPQRPSFGEYVALCWKRLNQDAADLGPGQKFHMLRRSDKRKTGHRQWYAQVAVFEPAIARTEPLAHLQNSQCVDAQWFNCPRGALVRRDVRTWQKLSQRNVGVV